VADFEVCREGRRRFGRNLASYIRWTMFCCADAGRFDECETRDRLYNVFVHFSVSPGLRTKTSNHANLSHGDISMVQCCPEMCQRYWRGAIPSLAWKRPLDAGNKLIGETRLMTVSS